MGGCRYSRLHALATKSSIGHHRKRRRGGAQCHFPRAVGRGAKATGRSVHQSQDFVSLVVGAGHHFRFAVLPSIRDLNRWAGQAHAADRQPGPHQPALFPHDKWAPTRDKGAHRNYNWYDER
ncbi:hypothetical protein IF1G_01417 [Cordyceps javanica]|uniref:Uncharacterized protein n=1 Tax=Cordyceps javanica TaxID=43265 RepID=A0A545VBS9_9HYPO|nr:hypothetical protein IF1G_01417 [Cordyceps javanica]